MSEQSVVGTTALAHGDTLNFLHRSRDDVKVHEDTESAQQAINEATAEKDKEIEQLKARLIKAHVCPDCLAETGGEVMNNFIMPAAYGVLTGLSINIYAKLYKYDCDLKVYALFCLCVSLALYGNCMMQIGKR